jgi:hypothetical protein
MIDFFLTPENTLDYAKIIGTIIVALVTSAFSLIICIINSARNKKTTFINTITTNRIEWMGKLKQLINDYLVMTELNKFSTLYSQTDKKLNYFRELSAKRNEIAFHLTSYRIFR